MGRLAGGAVLCALLALASPALGQQARVDYYDVQGADVKSVSRALNGRSAYHARADWKIRWTYDYRQGASGCELTALRTDLDLAVTMPRWAPRAGAPRDDLSRWEKYLAALRVHEEGHLEHGRRAERDIQAAARGMRSPDCAGLQRAVQERFERILAEYRAMDEGYDRSTGHGRTQGAWLGD